MDGMGGIARFERDAAGEAGAVAGRESAPVAFTAAIHAVTPLALDLSAMTGETVDVVNGLTIGALRYRLPGVPPGPQVRAFDLAALPDAGAGPLALPPLEGLARGGAVTPVDDAGNPAGPGLATGLRFTGGAYAQSQAALPLALALTGGWAIELTLRLAASAGSGGRVWAALGGERDGLNHGVTIAELSSGALRATIEGVAEEPLLVTSDPLPRGQMQAARLEWDAATGAVRWRVGGAPSGAAGSAAQAPGFAGGRLYLGTNFKLATNANPSGTIHRVAVEATNADQIDSWVAVGSTAALTRAQAAELAVDMLGVLGPVASAGVVGIRFATAAGESGPDLAVAVEGYANVVEELARFTAGESPFSPVDLGTARAGREALVLTAPARGKIATGSSRDFLGQGALVRVRGGVGGTVPNIVHEPGTGGTNPGQNPAGSTPRGFQDTIRLHQDGRVRIVTLTEMNRPPRLNGGGVQAGHADDLWVPIHALWNQYSKSNLRFPTIDGEAPVATVVEVPGPGEGSVRVGRTGPDLRVGDTVAWTDTRRLGWWKPGVAAVSPGCRLRLRLEVAGAPAASEDYALVITDAPRSVAPALWEQATTNFADDHTNLRWANRGGDWEGADGLWGAVPFVQSAGITAARTETLDVTAMTKAGGADYFLMLSSGGSVAVVPPNMTGREADAPLLRVVGGARAGEHRATRWGLITGTDSTGWKPTASSTFSLRRDRPMLLAFDTAGDAAALADATRIELLLVATGTTGGGGAVQLFRPRPQPPRPGPRVAVSPTPTAARADLLVKVDTDAEWRAMLDQVDGRNQRGSGQPDNWTVANGCYYGAIPTGSNTGMSLLRGFWREGGGGYARVRFARMVGWHETYRPLDANRFAIAFSGKSPGLMATQDENLSNGIEHGRGGIAVTGLSGWTCRMQRGSGDAHAAASPLAGWLSFADYNYFMHGDTNGLQARGICPVPRMRWVWIETVHAANSIHPDGSWSNDGVFELWVNGRRYVETRHLEYRVPGNPALWDAIWFDEYNGGQEESRVDRPWPFVVGPSYVVAGDAPVAPPPGWNVPFVGADGRPGATPLAYSPDF